MEAKSFAGGASVSGGCREAGSRADGAPIYLLMGKSASGKDTVYSKIADILACAHEGSAASDPSDNDGERNEAGKHDDGADARAICVRPITTATTRPPRTGEIDGHEYSFITDAQMDEAIAARRAIDVRSYDTEHGIWRYAVLSDAVPDAEPSMMINTPEGASHLATRYAGRIRRIYLRVDDGERLARALERERLQIVPRYAEMCRRFLADCSDFEGVEASADLIVDNDSPVRAACEIAQWILSDIRRWEAKKADNGAYGASKSE